MHVPGLIPLLIVLFLAFLLFGRPGRLSSAMEDIGKGIRGFKRGLTEGDAATPPAQPSEPPRQVADQAQPGAQSSDRTNS